MFRRILSRATIRNFGTASANFPKHGKSQGGHPVHGGPADKNWFKNWLKDPSAYPIMAITSFIVTVATFKLAFIDTGSPWFYWRKEERSTMDYLENDKDMDNYSGWQKNVWKTGPHKRFAPFEYELSKEMGDSKPDAVQRLKMKKHQEE